MLAECYPLRRQLGELVAVIELVDVSKTFKGLRRRRVALSKLNLEVREGGVHGFLGPNGSGKTTTIRILLGLIRPSGGSIKVLGRSVPRDLAQTSRDIGSLIEAPAFYGSISAMKNLQLTADLLGLGKARVEEALEIVGLSDRATDKLSTFSLGMKQRLAIASTLLAKPQLLVLDEPANGLDPQGIVEVRELIKGLGTHGGTTVFVSSHQLAEVAQMCDRISILKAGQCLLTTDIGSNSAGLVARRYRIRVSDASRARDLLANAGMTVSLHDEYLEVAGDMDPSQITRILASSGEYLSELTQVGSDLEAMYLRVAGEPA